jgi:hypothetical protein
MIRNYLQEQTRINPVFLPLSRTENTYESTAVDAQAQPHFEAGLGLFQIGDDTGGASGLAGTIKLLHSTDNATFVAVSGAQHTISALPSAAGVLAQIPFSPAGLHRYRKWELVLDFTGGSSPAVPVSGLEVLSGCAVEPVS